MKFWIQLCKTIKNKEKKKQVHVLLSLLENMFMRRV